MPENPKSLALFLLLLIAGLFYYNDYVGRLSVRPFNLNDTDIVMIVLLVTAAVLAYDHFVGGGKKH